MIEFRLRELQRCNGSVTVALLTVVRAPSISLQILEGTNEIMRVIVSRELLKD